MLQKISQTPHNPEYQTGQTYILDLQDGNRDECRAEYEYHGLGEY